MKIHSAQFLTSNTSVERLPQDGRPEYAFIGRSNVGKSSLINTLTERKGLAMTSSMPGKTLLINHFLINDAWYLVDLPGYGYARRGQKQREQLAEMIRRYVLEREQLTCLFVLVDSRHEPQRIDLEFITLLGEHGVPFALVFTKCDKLKGGALQRNVEAYKARLAQQWATLPPCFLTSAADGRGRQELLDFMAQYI